MSVEPMSQQLNTEVKGHYATYYGVTMKPTPAWLEASTVIVLKKSSAYLVEVAQRGILVSRGVYVQLWHL